ncbi:hypothetical protein BH24CHL8_BH24CHL8_09600 [soil metagenome]
MITASHRVFLVALLSFALCACLAAGPAGPIREPSLVGVVAATEILPDTGSNAKLVTFTDGRTIVYDARRLAPADPGGAPQAGMLVLYGEAPDGVWHVLMRELEEGCWGGTDPAQLEAASVLLGTGMSDRTWIRIPKAPDFDARVHPLEPTHGPLPDIRRA